MNAPSVEEILGWPVTVDVPTAGRCWLLGREASYRAARSGEFPVEVIRVGRRLVVTRASVIAALGIGHGDARGLSPPGDGTGSKTTHLLDEQERPTSHDGT